MGGVDWRVYRIFVRCRERTSGHWQSLLQRTLIVVLLVARLVLMRVGIVYIAMFLMLVMLLCCPCGGVIAMRSSSIKAATHSDPIYILDLIIALALLTCLQ